MIVVKIFQGPGNQMFQAAFGLAAARRLNTELKFDVSWYKDYSHHRQYILDRFNIDAGIATDQEIRDIITLNAPNIIAYKWNQLNRLHLRPYYQRPQILEPIDKFDINYTRIMDGTYVEGYFSSRDFFADHLNYVRQQLQFKTQPTGANKQLIEGIQSENAVAISFRLGDFLATPWQNICSLEYYQRCLDYLGERYSNLHLYVFSDDINWVRKNFKTKYPMNFMDFNAPDYMEDFRLLTHFKFHIIPNSTFSWWGALLADDNGKIVLCPQYWLHPDKTLYKDYFGGKAVDFSHVLPDGWIKIPNIVPGDKPIMK